MTKEDPIQQPTSDTTHNGADGSDNTGPALNVPHNDMKVLEYYNNTLIKIVDRQLSLLQEEHKHVERSLALLNGGGVIATLSFLASSTNENELSLPIYVLTLFVFGFISIILYHIFTSAKRAWRLKRFHQAQNNIEEVWKSILNDDATSLRNYVSEMKNQDLSKPRIRERILEYIAIIFLGVSCFFAITASLNGVDFLVTNYTKYSNFIDWLSQEYLPCFEEQAP